MLGGQGIQPITVVFNNTKNCFLHITSTLASILSLHEGQVLELCWDGSSPVYLSWMRCGHKSGAQDITVEVDRHLGDKLGIKEGEQGFLRPCSQTSSVQQVYVEPLSPDDWEILELHSSALEQKLLDQIRVVYPSGVFPLWVDQRTLIYIRIVSLSPSVPYGRLEQFTELVVSPKTRERSKSLATTHTSKPSGAIPDSSLLHRNHNQARRSGIPDLRSLVKYMLTGSWETKTEVPVFPLTPPILRDSVFRVCGAWPLPNMSQDSSCQDIHVFPWGEVRERQEEVTYGWLSKLEVAGMPQEGEKKTSATTGKSHRKAETGMNGNELETMVVRVVCHGLHQFGDGSIRRPAMYSGRVWIPEPCRRLFSIEPHSAVRIQPLRSAPKVGSSVALQPLQMQLTTQHTDEDIQSAFLEWLRAQSDGGLAFLTGRSAYLSLPVAGDVLEFALTVVKPECEDKRCGDAFLLSASLLQKGDIQVVREATPSPANTVKTDCVDLHAYPTLERLGGLEGIGKDCFEHVSHTLMAGPLFQKLGSTGAGLRGGALLITGPKGGGKTALSTALCREAAHVLDAHVEVVECKKLRGKRGDTVRQRLEQTLERAAWRQPSLVLLDDLDLLMGSPGSAEHDRGPEAVHCQHLAQGLRDVVDVWVEHGALVSLVVTSQSEHSLHPSLVEVQGSHFFHSFTSIPSPNQTERAEILQAVINSRSAISSHTIQSVDLEEVAKRTEGFLPRDLVLLVERALHTNALHARPVPDTEAHLITTDFLQALKGFTPPSLWQAKLQQPSTTCLEHVGGLHEARQLLMDTVLLPAKYPGLFSRLPIRQRSGVLLYGAPGTGKTLLAGAVARQSGMNFISIKGPELLSKYIGASEQAVRDVFERAQAARPCILFFDEFDSLAPRRGHDSTGVTDRVVNQLLTQLDGVEGLQGVYVLAASSRPDLIDPALLRPGRLDKCLYCPPPSQESRLEILKALTCSVALAGDVDLEQLACSTEGFTGADLKALLYNAQLEAVHGALGVPPTGPTDPGSGSDSDASLSSMIFLNHSSGSDDSAGEGEVGLEHSMVLLEAGEAVGGEEAPHNAWRLYFGSSYESELGNPSPELNSQCLSGPNSTALDLTGTSLRELGSLAPPAFMSSLQEGFVELSAERQEQLRAEISLLKANYRGHSLDESLTVPPGSTKPALLIYSAHLSSARASTRASISKQDWKRYSELYEAFSNTGSSGEGMGRVKPGQRVTLA